MPEDDFYLQQLGGGEGNEEVLPESTEFGFPLYLNTTVTYDEGYYQERSRAGDKILEDFYQWFEDNKVRIGSTTDQEIPSELLETNPIYIDGNRVVSIYMSAFGCNIGFENNMYNDKTIYTLDFSFSSTELVMYIYFDV